MTTAPASDPSTATSYVLRNLNFYLEGRAIAIDMFGVLGLPTQVRDPHVTLFFRSAGFGQTEVAAVRTKVRVCENQALFLTMPRQRNCWETAQKTSSFRWNRTDRDPISSEES